MSGLPSVTVIGTITADPELKFLPSGVALASFSVAANERKRADNGDWIDGAATFLRCTVWRQMAENVVESLTRGTRVVVTGRLRQREFEKDGVKRTAFELDVDEVAPSLKWATAKVQKASRDGGSSPAHGSSGTGGGAPATDDPWGSAPVPSNAGPDEEPPF